MTLIEAILLGIVQGLTEFLPVSSSGHLKLAEYLFGFKDLDQYILFDLCLHLGTIAAIFVFFYRPLWIVLRFDRIRVWQVVIGTLPLFPLVLLLKQIEWVFAQPRFLGFFFLLTAALLYAGIVIGRKRELQGPTPEPKRDALIIGLFQALAILPGVSRSGSTISGARMLGWSYHDAIFFSFLLAIPAILGSSILMLGKAIATNGEHIAQLSYLQYLLGFVTSFIVGLFALGLLTRIAAKDKFMVFVWYTLGLGLITLISIR